MGDVTVNEEKTSLANNKKIEERKEKVKKWLKDPYNLGLIAVLIFAFVLRLYYFFVTIGQPLWWDEAEYMATAKKWAFGISYNINEQRPPLFQLMAAGLLKLGFSEAALKFVLVLLPSIFLVYAIYLFGKETFNKKVGLIAAFASAFMWSYLFWAFRFQPDFFSMSFQMLALLSFWKLFKHEKRNYAILAGFFTVLSFYFKISSLLIPLIILCFVFIKDGFGFIKNKNYWISLLVFIIIMIPFMIWQYTFFGNPLAFAPSYSTQIFNEDRNLGWMTLYFYSSFATMPLLIFFFVGLFLTLGKGALIFDVVLRKKERRFSPKLFSILALLIVSLFYIFYIQGVIEDRWVFLISPFIFYLAADGLLKIGEKIKIFSKYFPLLLVIVVLIFSMYLHLQHASQIIEVKKNTYGEVKDSSLWIKDNSNFNDKILSNSYTQATAYSEREIIPYPYWKRVNTTSFVPMKKEELDALIEENKPRYIVFSVFEKHPDWTQEWIKENSGKLRPVRAYFADLQQTQVLLVVYELNYQSL